jgi:hypothetical protein|tara:strand:- start:1255 stop:1989 length:735 start_codon:yes stop_codon:yes gene_type:complete
MPMFLTCLVVMFMVAVPITQTGRSNVEESYGARRSSASTRALLGGDGEAWEGAKKVTWGPQIYTTSFQALWGEEGLFVRFDAVDPSPWYTLTNRDDHLWTEEVVEIFIDPDGDGRNYAEIEISPHNVVCDLMIFEGAPNVRSDIGWDHDGLQSKVSPLSGADGETVGWMAIAVLPWSSFATLTDSSGISIPPHSGDVWRFNIFRIKRPFGPTEPDRDVVYAAWSPPSGRSFHEPTVFRALEFIE